MNPPASTKSMHCDHECVCYKYRSSYWVYENGNAIVCPMGSGIFLSCPSDTRARGPVHSGAQQQAPCGSNPGECLIKMNKQIEQAAAAERERVIDEISLAIESKKDYGGNKETLFHLTGLRCIIDSFRSQPEHICGDDPRCHGECSGEVDGTSNCPCKQPEKQQEGERK